MILSTALVVFILCLTEASYLPELAPVSFCNVDKGKCQSTIKLFVNRLDSVENIIPYEYSSFDFCPGTRTDDASPSENLGQVVFGERIRPSLYQFKFGESKECELVCKKFYHKGKAEDQEKLDFLRKGIGQNYQHHWIIDNMPVTWCYAVADSVKTYCSTGFPIGCFVTESGEVKDACVISNKFEKAGTYYVFNHVHIEIKYKESWEGARLLSAKITPDSIEHVATNDGKAQCKATKGIGIPAKGKVDFNIQYTYDVIFRHVDDAVTEVEGEDVSDRDSDLQQTYEWGREMD